MSDTTTQQTPGIGEVLTKIAAFLDDLVDYELTRGEDAGRVELVKVACDEKKVEAFVDQLVKTGHVKPDKREAWNKYYAGDPNRVLEFCDHMLRPIVNSIEQSKQASAAPQGAAGDFTPGGPSPTSNSDADEDGWKKVKPE